MDKKSIILITATSGDFEYIDEWIEYHHNLGVEYFLIGYNGPSEKFRNYKQYDYVKYIDFSYNSLLNNSNFTGFPWSVFREGIDSYEPENAIRQAKIDNMLITYAYWFFKDSCKYCVSIDIDEFITVNTEENIYDYFDKYLNNEVVGKITMYLYSDSGHIYKTNEPCVKRFTIPSWTLDTDYSKKIIINMDNISNINDIYLYCPHRSVYGLNHNIITLSVEECFIKHFTTKTIEEWIEKMKPENDSEYFIRWEWSHTIFDGFFARNEVTDEKIKAIPELLKKYKIDYDINLEPETEFKTRYFEIFPEQKHN